MGRRKLNMASGRFYDEGKGGNVLRSGGYDFFGLYT
jgi:hypothetical protein